MRIFNYLYQHINDNIQIHTNGCDICIYDARKFANTLPKDEKAIVYNTCSVFGIREIENKLLINLLKTTYPDYKLYILGCDVNNHPENYNQYENTYTNEDIKNVIEVDNIDDSVKTNEELIYVKIQDGCPHKCSFCIINQLRSNPYSVPYKRIVQTIRQQIVGVNNPRIELAGTELTTYYDEESGYNLVDALHHLLEDIPEIGRITMTSIDPQPKVTEDLIKLVGTHKDKFVPYLLLAVQSGSDKILKLMNRRHNVERIRELHKIAEDYGVSLGWDIIVGFPDESEEDFEKTYDLMMELKPLTQTIFMYSPREGTPAAIMDNQIPQEIKQERLDKLRKAVKSYSCKETYGFNPYAEYTEELEKYSPCEVNKKKLYNLMTNDHAIDYDVDLMDVNSIAYALKNADDLTTIYVDFIPEKALECEIYINFFKEFIPGIPIVVSFPKDYEIDFNEFEKVYHCIVWRN